MVYFLLDTRSVRLRLMATISPSLCRELVWEISSDQQGGIVVHSIREEDGTLIRSLAPPGSDLIVSLHFITVCFPGNHTFHTAFLDSDLPWTIGIPSRPVRYEYHECDVCAARSVGGVMLRGTSVFSASIINVFCKDCAQIVMHPPSYTKEPSRHQKAVSKACLTWLKHDPDNCHVICKDSIDIGKKAGEFFQENPMLRELELWSTNQSILTKMKEIDPRVDNYLDHASITTSVETMTETDQEHK